MGKDRKLLVKTGTAGETALTAPTEGLVDGTRLAMQAVGRLRLVSGYTRAHCVHLVERLNDDERRQLADVEYADPKTDNHAKAQLAIHAILQRAATRRQERGKGGAGKGENTPAAGAPEEPNEESV